MGNHMTSLVIHIIEGIRMITKEDLETQDFKDKVRMLKRIKGVKKLILVGSLAKKGKASKDIDILMVVEKIDLDKEFKDSSERILFDKIDGFHHVTTNFNYSQFEHLMVKIPCNCELCKKGLISDSSAYYPIDLWLTDLAHLKMALKRFGIKKIIEV